MSLKLHGSRSRDLSRAIVGVSLALAVAACEPGVQLGWDIETDRRIDRQCVYQALNTVAPHVKQWSYVSDGDNGMPARVQVIQFVYARTKPEGTFLVEVADLPGDGTRIHHSWAKIGRSISKQEKIVVEPVLRHANEAIAEACDLSFRSDGPSVLR